MLFASTAIPSLVNNGGTMEDHIKNNVISFKNLYAAMYKCKRNVMWKDSVSGYLKNGLANCHRLKKQLENESYKIDKYNLFTIHEPKRREIVSTRMKDRVFQRSLTDNYLYDEVTKSFIYDNCACQVGKGTDFARNRLKCHMQRHYRKHDIEGYVLSCDIKNYFGSTTHEIAKAEIGRLIQNTWATEHVNSVIDSFDQGDDPDVGVGLGSQITQIGQLAVLNRLDHFIKEDLKIKRYIRYMDDFHLIHKDKEYLKTCRKEIENFLDTIELSVNQKKTQIYPLKQGINFLGFKFSLTDSGKVILKIKKDNISKERRKLKRMSRLVKDGKLTKEKVDECYLSWKAHAKKGNSYNLLKKMDEYYENLWEV